MCKCTHIKHKHTFNRFSLNKHKGQPTNRKSLTDNKANRHGVKIDTNSQKIVILWFVDLHPPICRFVSYRQNDSFGWFHKCDCSHYSITRDSLSNACGWSDANGPLCTWLQITKTKQITFIFVKCWKTHRGKKELSCQRDWRTHTQQQKKSIISEESKSNMSRWKISFYRNCRK